MPPSHIIPAIATLMLLMVRTASSQPSATTAAAPDFAAVDAYVREALAADRVPGAAIAIVHDGRIVHVRGFGHDGRGHPVTAETGFVLGSMSKAFTALAIMQLVEQQRIALDAPVHRYLPWFRVADSTASATITVRQLLLHTSGIPTFANRAIGESRQLVDHVRALASVKLAQRPGLAHEYASPNYLVLGAIVEAVTGRPFGRYVEEEIFAPLEMRHSFTNVVQGAAGISRGHVYAFGFPIPTDLPHEYDRLPTAGLISSATDIGHFLIAQLNDGQLDGRRVVGAPSVRLMHTGAAPAEGFSYGFGWRESRRGDVRVVHHGGIVPNFRGKMAMLPERRWGVVVLTNSSSGIPFPLEPTSHRIADAVVAHLAGERLAAPGSRHRTFFAMITVVMAAVVAAQLRSLWRVLQHGRAAGRRSVWRAAAVDLMFVIAVLVFAPRFAGASWPTFLRIAPDLGWWMVLLVTLTMITIATRLRLLRGA